MLSLEEIKELELAKERARKEEIESETRSEIARQQLIKKVVNDLIATSRVLMEAAVKRGENRVTIFRGSDSFLYDHDPMALHPTSLLSVTENIQEVCRQLREQAPEGITVGCDLISDGVGICDNYFITVSWPSVSK